MVEKVIEAAMDLVQKHGYNAFSYRDLSARVKIKTASIHYYFPKKGDLGEALMRRYREAFAQALANIDREARSVDDKLSRYAGLFERTFQASEKVCLGGMLACEFLTLPEPVRSQVKAFFTDNETWLTGVIRTGKEAGVFHTKVRPEVLATTVVSALEGAMIAARTFHDPDRLASVGTCIRQLLKGTK